MRTTSILAAVAALLAQSSHAATGVCATGFYALLAPLASDANVKAFCAAKYKPGTRTVTATVTTTPRTTVVSTSTIAVTSTSSSTVTSTVVSTSTLPVPDPNDLKKRATTPTTTTKATGKAALLSQLSVAAQGVVSTACSCLYGGASVSTVTTTATANQKVTTSTTTITTTSIANLFATTTVTSTTTVPYINCFCDANNVGQLCGQPGGNIAGVCGQHVGTDNGYYCIYFIDGCSRTFQCDSDAYCATRGNPGSNKCFFYQANGCNTCGNTGMCPAPA